MNGLEFEYIQFSSLCHVEYQFSKFECRRGKQISFFNSRSEKLLEDETYFAKVEMPSSNTHAIPWGNILLWTPPPLLAYTALKLST